MRIEVVRQLPGGGDNLVTLDVTSDDEERAHLVEKAKWRVLAKLHRVRRENDLVMVVCDHRDERGRGFAVALGLDVDRVGADEPAVGMAPAGLVQKIVGASIPAITGDAFCLVVVTAGWTAYTVRDRTRIA